MFCGKVYTIALSTLKDSLLAKESALFIYNVIGREPAGASPAYGPGGACRAPTRGR